MTSNRVFLCANLEHLFVKFFQSKINNIVPVKMTASLIVSRAKNIYLSSEKHYEVRGNLYTLEADFSSSWPLVDEYLGAQFFHPQKGLFARLECEVYTDLNNSKEAEKVWGYFINSKKLAQPVSHLENGNWKDLGLSSLANDLTEKQRNYLQKLGAVSGREIVPIQDLSLYRELMKLELVVDKGRRLALSKLGQEVYRTLSL